MKTNYEILKGIKEEINHFKYDVSDIETTLSISNWELDEMYEKEPELLEDVFSSVIKVKSGLDKITYGMKCLLEESDIDIESFEWCVGKVLHCDIEIINYLESFDNFINELDFVVGNRISEFEILLENVSEEDEEE